VINAIKFAIEEIEASDQYFDHTGLHPLESAAFSRRTPQADIRAEPARDLAADRLL
jgi:hypothetical protein